MVKCSKVLQCSDGTSNKVSNIIIRHIDNRELLLTCIFTLITFSARVILAKTGHSSKIVVLLYVLLFCILCIFCA